MSSHPFVSYKGCAFFFVLPILRSLCQSNRRQDVSILRSGGSCIELLICGYWGWQTIRLLNFLKKLSNSLLLQGPCFCEPSIHSAVLLCLLLLCLPAFSFLFFFFFISLGRYLLLNLYRFSFLFLFQRCFAYDKALTANFKNMFCTDLYEFSNPKARMNVSYVSFQKNRDTSSTPHFVCFLSFMLRLGTITTLWFGLKYMFLVAPTLLEISQGL